jgi:hypothetical protein
MVTRAQIFVAGLLTVAVQGLPQPQVAQPSALPTPGLSAENNAQLFSDLFTAPTAIKRFQKLLVDGETLLTGDRLKQLIVFDFNGASSAAGAKGGKTSAAVSITPPDRLGIF